MTTTIEYTEAALAGVYATLVAEAEESHAQYPQYAGHWDGWVPARVKRDIKSRGATVARKGDVVLIDPESFTTEESPEVIAGWHAPGMVTAFLPRHYIKGGCDTSVKATWIEVLS